MVGRAGFEPAKVKPTDLQSVLVGRLSISPKSLIKELFKRLPKKIQSLWRDSNPRPADYKSAALANWATSANLLVHKKKNAFFPKLFNFGTANVWNFFLSQTFLRIILIRYFFCEKSLNQYFVKVRMKNKKKAIVCVSNDLVTDNRVARTCLVLEGQNYEVILVGRQKKNSPPMSQKSFRWKRLKLPFEKGPLFYIALNLRLLLFL